VLLKSTLSLTAVLAALASPALPGLVDWQDDVTATEAPPRVQPDEDVILRKMTDAVAMLQDAQAQAAKAALQTASERATRDELLAEKAELERLVIENKDMRRLVEEQVRLTDMRDRLEAAHRRIGPRINALRLLARDNVDVASEIDRLKVLSGWATKLGESVSVVSTPKALPQAAQDRGKLQARIGEAKRRYESALQTMRTYRVLNTPAPEPPAAARVRTGGSDVTIIVEQGDVHVHMAGGGAPRIVRSDAPKVRETRSTTRARLAPKPPEPPADRDGVTVIPGRVVEVDGTEVSTARLYVTPRINRVIELRKNLELKPTIVRTLEIETRIVPEPDEPEKPENCPDYNPFLVSAPTPPVSLTVPAPLEGAANLPRVLPVFPSTGRLVMANEVVTYTEPTPDELLQRMLALVEDLTRDVETLRAEVQGLRGDILPAPRRSTGGIR
jgi:hypothetical protein